MSVESIQSSKKSKSYRALLSIFGFAALACIVVFLAIFFYKTFFGKKVDASFLVSSSLLNLFNVKANNNIGFSVGVSFIGKGSESGCDGSCARLSVGEVRAIGEISFDIMVGGIFQAKYRADTNEVIAKGLVFGDEACRSL